MSLADARWGGLTAKKKWSILTIKKMVWESYSTKEKGMLKYAGDPLRFDSPVSLNTHCGRSPARLGGIDFLI
jgi:hypothetical protein